LEQEKNCERYLMTTAEDLSRLIGPYLEAEQLELDDIELVGRGRGRTLRVVVDAPGGVDVDRLSQVSRLLSRLLDAESDLSGPYQMEVTSPGLERKLRRPSHFQKSIGREVVVKAASASIRGILTEAGDESFVVKEGDDEHRMEYESVESARTVFRWETSARPGKGGRR
jgi:ribosome maturation factor RimP